MKARVLVLLLVCVSGLTWGQLTFNGSWSTTFNLLPTPDFGAMKLSLNMDLAGWKIGGIGEWFGEGDGWVWQTFVARGAVGPVKKDLLLLFGPRAPAFLYALSTTKFVIAGIEFTHYAAYVGRNAPGYLSGGPSAGTVTVLKYDLAGMPLTLAVGFGAYLRDFTIRYVDITPPVRIKTFPVDPFPGGFRFTYLKLELKRIVLCCGMTADLVFSFTRTGFESAKFTIKTIPFCCGISFDAVITYTTTSKAVEFVPQWQGIKGCLTVYGDVQVRDRNILDALEIYGFRVRCELAECNYAEFLTAFNVPKIEEILERDIFKDREFQYVKLGFCGPGCCGGRYTLELAAYFQPRDSLFGLRRLSMQAEIPIMVNFMLHFMLEGTLGVPTPVNFAFGWTFTFDTF